jgi:hypothetical protein
VPRRLPYLGEPYEPCPQMFPRGPEMERGRGARNGAWGNQQDRIETIQKRSRKFRDVLVLVFRTSPSLGLRQRQFPRMSCMLSRSNYLETYSMTYAAKAKTQQFITRKSNLVKKADQLARLCHADLALIIRKNGRYYTYRSTDHERWPPTITEIVRMNPIHRS